MFDTLGLARAWEKAGMPRDQAQEMVAALATHVESGVASAHDLKQAEVNLEKAIAEAKLEMVKAIADSRVAMVQWFAGIMVGSVIAIIAALFTMLRVMLP